MPTHPDLLVGAETGDDAAVWRLSDERALVVTADFITPVLDDPRLFGKVAAANAASDVYAMGGRPFMALNLVAWNTDELGTEALSEVLAGAAEVASEGGWITAGGHSVEDPEPKFGLAVIGEVHPDRILTNAGLRPGELLVLTKALGVGILATSIKKDGPLDPRTQDALVASMTRLNGEAAIAALDAGARGATDITGFGLLGHLRRMVQASSVGAELDPSKVAVLPLARELAEQGKVPSGTKRNLQWASELMRSDPKVSQVDLLLLADAQTSGGLLFGAPSDAAYGAVEKLRSLGHAAAVVGRVNDSGFITVKRGLLSD